MVVLALLSDPPVVTRILAHLGLPTQTPPLTPAHHRDLPLEEAYAPAGSNILLDDRHPP